jgi:hypothetical protein
MTSRTLSRTLVMVALVGATLALAGPAHAAVSIVWPNNNPTSDPYFGVVTSKGVYYIARQCYNEAPTAGRNGADMGAFGNEIGPGYIFATSSVDPDGAWRTKTRDYLDVSQSDPRGGGWAKFGLHVARSVPYPEGVYYKELQTGICRPYASGPSDPGESKDPFYYGGVSHVDGVVGPFVSGAEVVFGINVYLNDGYDDVVKVTYNYRIDDTHVRLWTAVQQLCNNGACPSGHGTVYVKEPKFTISDYGYNSADPTWSPYNYNLGVSVSSVFPNGWDYACWNAAGTSYRVYAPTATFGQSLHCANYDTKPNQWRYRQQLWFKYNDTGSVTSDCTQRCTWVIAKGASSGDPATAALGDWTNAGLGLDQWAVNEATRIPYKDASTQPSYCTSHYPSDLRDMRRWEIGGAGPSTSPDGTTVLQAGLHGWTGGSGLSDCQNLFRVMGSSGSVYANYFEFSFQ